MNANATRSYGEGQVVCQIWNKVQATWKKKVSGEKQKLMKFFCLCFKRKNESYPCAPRSKFGPTLLSL